MKNNYKKVSSHGSINIPVAMRREIGIQGGDPMEVSLNNGMVTVKPYTPRCIFCGTNEKVVHKLHGKYICVECAIEALETVGGGEK
ncbi:MAG: AbrB/MazE/SpoVT family DNA-binding domain-containing protein [Roseburia sp.]|nr:AbrB/MazE/SpoVT family DNA-binding domain-containing protein [Roseburia sp.]